MTDIEMARPTGPLMSQMLVQALDNVLADPAREGTIRALAESDFYVNVLDGADSPLPAILQAAALELRYAEQRQREGIEVEVEDGQRRMTRHLARLLDDLTGDKRNHVAQVLSEGSSELLRALGQELYLAALREDLTLQEFRREWEDQARRDTEELAAKFDAPEPPAPTGPALVLDPGDHG